MNTRFSIDFPFNLFRLAVSAIPQIEKTRSCCCYTQPLSCQRSNIRIYILIFFHHSRGLVCSLGYVNDSVSVKYNETSLSAWTFDFSIIVASIFISEVSFSPNKSKAFLFSSKISLSFSIPFLFLLGIISKVRLWCSYNAS